MNLAQSNAETEMDMNMTPMIDVVFLLVIFFMLVSDLSQKDLEDIELPQSNQAVHDRPDPQRVRPIVNIHQSGEIIVRRETLFDPESEEPLPYRRLEHYLSDTAARMKREVLENGRSVPKEPVLLRVDATTPFVSLQRVLELCAKPGIDLWRLELGVSEMPNQPTEE